MLQVFSSAGAAEDQVCAGEGSLKSTAVTWKWHCHERKKDGKSMNIREFHVEAFAAVSRAKFLIDGC